MASMSLNSNKVWKWSVEKSFVSMMRLLGFTRRPNQGESGNCTVHPLADIIWYYSFIMENYCNTEIYDIIDGEEFMCDCKLWECPGSIKYIICKKDGKKIDINCFQKLNNCVKYNIFPTTIAALIIDETNGVSGVEIEEIYLCKNKLYVQDTINNGLIYQISWYYDKIRGNITLDKLLNLRKSPYFVIIKKGVFGETHNSRHAMILHSVRSDGLIGLFNSWGLELPAIWTDYTNINSLYDIHIEYIDIKQDINKPPSDSTICNHSKLLGLKQNILDAYSEMIKYSKIFHTKNKIPFNNEIYLDSNSTLFHPIQMIQFWNNLDIQTDIISLICWQIVRSLINVIIDPEEQNADYFYEGPIKVALISISNGKKSVIKELKKSISLTLKISNNKTAQINIIRDICDLILIPLQMIQKYDNNYYIMNYGEIDVESIKLFLFPLTKKNLRKKLDDEQLVNQLDCHIKNDEKRICLLVLGYINNNTSFIIPFIIKILCILLVSKYSSPKIFKKYVEKYFHKKPIQSLPSTSPSPSNSNNNNAVKIQSIYNKYLYENDFK